MRACQVATYTLHHTRPQTLVSSMPLVRLAREPVCFLGSPSQHLTSSVTLSPVLAVRASSAHLVLPTQFSSESGVSDGRQQLQQAMEERAQLEKHVQQVRLGRRRGAVGGGLEPRAARSR